MTRHKTTLAVLIMLFLVVALVSPASAQDDFAPNPTEVERMMEAYVLSKLQESLQLDDEQFGRLVVAQKQLQDVRREYRRERMSVLRRMRQTLRAQRDRDKELEDLLDRLASLDEGFSVTEKTRYAAIDGILDVRQRARYRVVEQEIQRRLQQLMRRVRGDRNPAQRGGANPRNQRRPFP